MSSDDPKPFLDHLEDLRWTIIKCALALVIAMTLSCVYTPELIEILKQPLLIALKGRPEQPSDFLKTIEVMDAFNLVFQTGLFAGVILALPFILFFIGQFIIPALTWHERKMLLPTFAVGGLLFMGGVLFCYFLIMPNTILAFLQLNDWVGARAEWTIQNYLGFVLQMLAAFGLSFELPLVIVILARLGIVSKAFLSRYRRHAIIILLVFAAAITPTSDPFTLMALFVPLYLLFEISIWIAGLIETKRQTELEST
jgi:sec-independent protein translocase protein TatC